MCATPSVSGHSLGMCTVNVSTRQTKSLKESGSKYLISNRTDQQQKIFRDAYLLWAAVQWLQKIQKIKHNFAYIFELQVHIKLESISSFQSSFSPYLKIKLQSTQQGNHNVPTWATASNSLKARQGVFRLAGMHNWAMYLVQGLLLVRHVWKNFQSKVPVTLWTDTQPTQIASLDVVGALILALPWLLTQSLMPLYSENSF